MTTSEAPHPPTPRDGPHPPTPRDGPHAPTPSPASGRGGGSVLATVGVIFAALLGVVVIGLSGIGFILLLIFDELDLPFAAPGILLFLMLICLPLGMVTWGQQRSGGQSRPLRMPGPLLVAAGAAAVIVLGQLAQLGRVSPVVMICFWLAAALPPLVAVALASQRLPDVTTWRRAIFGLVVGGMGSTTLTLLVGGAVTLAAYAVLLPFRELMARIVASPDLERLFFSPALAFAIVETAVVAPLVEELTKPLAAILLGRRLRSRSEALLVGMAAGAGFAVVENMMYESGGFRLWAAVATLRGIGGVLHPLNAGLVAVGWYDVLVERQPGSWRRLFGLYALAVTIHALWNGGLALIFSTAGAYFFATDTWRISVYGLGQPGIVLAFMALEAIALWRLLILTTDRLRGGSEAVDGGIGLRLNEPRRLAVWALGLILVIVPIGMLYGPLVTRYADRLTPLR